MCIHNVGTNATPQFIVGTFHTQYYARVTVKLIPYGQPVRVRAYIWVVEWYNTPHSFNLLERIRSNGSAKIVFNDPHWWSLETMAVSNQTETHSIFHKQMSSRSHFLAQKTTPNTLSPTTTVSDDYEYEKMEIDSPVLSLKDLTCCDNYNYVDKRGPGPDNDCLSEISLDLGSDDEATDEEIKWDMPWDGSNINWDTMNRCAMSVC